MAESPAIQDEVHTLLAERRQLQSRVHELTVEIEVARQMQRIHPLRVDRPAAS